MIMIMIIIIVNIIIYVVLVSLSTVLIFAVVIMMVGNPKALFESLRPYSCNCMDTGLSCNDNVSGFRVQGFWGLGFRGFGV